MSQYRESHLISAESLFSSSAGYRDRSITLAQMLAPGFFPARVGLALDEMVYLIASDGWVVAKVSGFDIDRNPILEPPRSGIEPAPSAEPESLKLTRKAA